MIIEVVRDPAGVTGVIDEGVIGRPTGPAAAVVASYHGYRQRGVAPARHLGLPSPYLTLIFTLDEPLEIVEHVDGRPPRSYDALAGGLHTTPAVITHGGRQSGIQVQIHPHAARALFGLPAGELAGTDGDADAVLGQLVDRVRNRMGEAATWAQRFAVLDDELGALVARAAAEESWSGPPPAVVNAWRLLRRSRGAMPVGTLADAVGYSDRRLSTLFDAEIGLTPKTAARVIRFDRARRAAQVAPPGTLGRIAAEHGYADQSHLVRDFVAFTGRSPRKWLAEEFGNVQAKGRPPSAD